MRFLLLFHWAINLAYYYNDGKDVAGAFYLFQGYERSISDKEVQIAVTPQFLHLFNSLEREFTTIMRGSPSLQ